MSNIFNLRSKADRTTKLNVLGHPLDECGCEPMTGWFRDGYCHTSDIDFGHHVVCCVMTEDFLDYSKSVGNDLSTPRPESGFEGLKEGDHWCVCATRWVQAAENKKAPLVLLESTHMSALTVIPEDILKKYAYTKEIKNGKND